MKIANRDAREYVIKQHPFEGSNLYGTYFCTNPSSTQPGDSGYAVFSYGEHWPLFISVYLNGNDTWFENEDRHSVTTSKHRNQTHPHCPTVLLSRASMLLLFRKGYKAIAKERILGPSPQPVKQQRDPVWLSAHGM